MGGTGIVILDASGGGFEGLVRAGYARCFAGKPLRPR